MTGVVLLFLLWASPVPSSLEQVKAEPNPEHRARAALVYAAAAEKNAEAAHTKGDAAGVSASLKEISDSFELAEESYGATGKSPGRNPGTYKYAEVHSRELLVRLGDLENSLDGSERAAATEVKAKVQNIHDAWFEGIMGKSK